MPLFLDIYLIYSIGYNIEVDEEMIYTYNILVGVFRLDVGLHWNCIDVIVLGLKSVEELYLSPPLEVDSADTSQLPKEKNLHRKFETNIPRKEMARGHSPNFQIHMCLWAIYICIPTIDLPILLQENM